MNPGGKVRCNMWNQIRLANHNCNFYRLKARVLLPSTQSWRTPFASWQTPARRQKQALGGSGRFVREEGECCDGRIELEYVSVAGAASGTRWCTRRAATRWLRR